MKYMFEVTLRINGSLPNQAKAATVDTWEINQLGEQ